MTGTVMWKRTTTGEWAVYGPADTITQGATVTVTTRSGETSTEYIAETHRARRVGGVQMAYGLPGRDPATLSPVQRGEVSPCAVDDRCQGGCRDDQQHVTYRAALPREQRFCTQDLFCVGHCDTEAEHAQLEAARDAAAQQPPRRNVCAACGTRRATTTVEDSNGTVGRVCTRCAADPDLTIH